MLSYFDEILTLLDSHPIYRSRAYCSGCPEQRFGHLKRGWGSLRVSLVINGVKWETSIFTDKPRRSYLLPLKADKRRDTGIAAGDTVEVVLTVLP